jgi:hypothetical protein
MKLCYLAMTTSVMAHGTSNFLKEDSGKLSRGAPVLLSPRKVRP